MIKFTGVLIGNTIAVEHCSIDGKVINETKNTLTLKTEKGDKKVIKKQHSFIINSAKVMGEQLIGRPEERIKLR